MSTEESNQKTTEQKYLATTDISENDHETIVTTHDTLNPITRVVLIALDHSDYSKNAFEWAVKNFLRKESDLVVLVNVRPLVYTGGPLGPSALSVGYMEISNVYHIDEQYRTNSYQLLHEYGTKLKAQDFAVKAISMRGDPRDEITSKAKEVDADTLILGSRGLGIFKRAFLGSTSDYCVHNCDCTVIIVKGSDPHGQH
ncbi:hypothetical protein G9A89_010109 [Geosiphon pyriformis]|nr:hypothetical protein G9A89_010109 [Geosiphon pyriformis]